MFLLWAPLFLGFSSTVWREELELEVLECLAHGNAINYFANCDHCFVAKVESPDWDDKVIMPTNDVSGQFARSAFALRLFRKT